MLYQLSYEATDVGSIVGSYVPVKEMNVIDIWNKSYMNWGNEMKMKKWWSQRTQFMQLRKEAWKNKNKNKNKKTKFRTSTGFETVTSRLPVRCSTKWAMKPLTLAAGQLHKLRSHVLFPEPLRFVWICLGFLLFRILYITGATKGYHFDLTVGFSHWSLRSTFSHQVTKVNLFGL